MLATLLQEELLSKGRGYLQVLAVLAVAGIGAFAVGTVPALMGAELLTTLTFTIVIVDFLVAVPIVVVSELIDYWQSMYGQRGYLTMSIPARGREVFGAKVVFSLAVTLVSIIFAALGVAAVVIGSAWVRGVTVDSLISPLHEVIDAVGTGFFWGFVVFLVLQLLSWVVITEAVMSLGAQARWNRMGIAAPIIGVLLVYLINQVLMVVAIILVPVGLDLASHQIVSEGSLPSMVETWGTGEDLSVLGLGFLPVPLLLALVLAWRAVPAIERRTSLR
ncbi:hypothetical protein [Actinomyces faecalis]|uniref:hypothetical protein n=1 Tax=Actinomyces faecalis TaxID=2722820 RepID=UPI00155190F8|nr:hypothetical protein [Actinomyces faecalis]